MADVLGTVASIIQIADAAKKLKDIFDDVRDAPTNVKHLARQVDTLSMQCSTIAAHANLQTLAAVNGSTLTRSLRLCEATIANLKPVLQDLEAKVSKHTKRGSLWAALKKDVLETYHSRVGDAQSSLQLAYNIFINEVRSNEQKVLQHEQRSMRQDYSMLQQDLNQHFQTFMQNQNMICNIVGSTDSRIASLEATMRALTLGSANRARPRANQNLSPRPEYADVAELPPDFRLATLWMGHVLLRSIQGWKASLGFWTELPDRTPQVRACLTGDLPKLKQLFRERQATPFDRLRHGFSYVHIAFQHSEMIEDSKRGPLALFALQQGADRGAIDGNGWSLVDMFINWHAGCRIPRVIDQTTLDVLKLLIQHDDVDCEALYWQLIGHLRYTQFLPIVDEQLWPQIAERSVEGLVDLALSKHTHKETSTRMQVFVDIVGYKRINPSVLTWNVDYFPTLMEYLAVAIVEKKTELADQLTLLLKDAARIGFDLAQVGCIDDYGKLPVTGLGAFLRSYLQRAGWSTPPCRKKDSGNSGNEDLGALCAEWLQNRIQRVLLIWLEYLRAAGLNLVRYGEQESEAFAQWYDYSKSAKKFFAHSCAFGRQGDDDLYYDIDFFVYGPRADDWRVHIFRASESERMKRVRLTEKGESDVRLALPGAWVET